MFYKQRVHRDVQVAKVNLQALPGHQQLQGNFSGGR